MLEIIEADEDGNQTSKAPQGNPMETQETVEQPTLDQTVESLSEANPTQDQSDTGALPDKYRGKTQAEIIQMHQEAEKLAGRQSNEVGELRRLVDSYILTQTSNAPASGEVTEEEDVDELDFFDNPQEAVNRAVANHPKVKALEATESEAAKKTAVNEIQKSVPDIAEQIVDPKFQEWVKKDPVRLELLARVDQYDVSAAKSLFGTWGEIRGVVQTETKQSQEDRTNQIRKADTGSAKGTSESTTSKKVYRRIDIMKLMTEDPDRYDALSGEIMKAYAEGRVK